MKVAIFEGSLFDLGGGFFGCGRFRWSCDITELWLWWNLKRYVFASVIFVCLKSVYCSYSWVLLFSVTLLM